MGFRHVVNMPSHSTEEVLHKKECTGLLDTLPTYMVTYVYGSNGGLGNSKIAVYLTRVAMLSHPRQREGNEVGQLQSCRSKGTSLYCESSGENGRLDGEKKEGWMGVAPPIREGNDDTGVHKTRPLG